MHDVATRPGRATRVPSPAWILAVVGFSVFVAADDLTVVSTMLRPIIGDLGLEPMSVTFLLMEHARREDEASEATRRDKRVVEHSGPFDHDL